MQNKIHARAVACRLPPGDWLREVIFQCAVVMVPLWGLVAVGVWLIS